MAFYKAKKKVPPHPDAVAYFESLSACNAAVHPPVVREHEQGFIQY